MSDTPNTPDTNPFDCLAKIAGNGKPTKMYVECTSVGINTIVMATTPMEACIKALHKHMMNYSPDTTQLGLPDTDQEEFKKQFPDAKMMMLGDFWVSFTGNTQTYCGYATVEGNWYNPKDPLIAEAKKEAFAAHRDNDIKISPIDLVKAMQKLSDRKPPSEFPDE